MKARSLLFGALLPFLSGPLLWASTAGCRSQAGGPTPVDVEVLEVSTGPARWQTVVPGLFLGGPDPDLAVVSDDGRGGRTLRLFALRGGAWTPALERTLERDVAFVDVLRAPGRDRLVFRDDRGLTALDPGATERVLLVPLSTSLAVDRTQGVPHLDVTRDLDGDGRDDLVLPDRDGFRIAMQAHDGSLSDPVALGPAEPYFDTAGLESGRPYGELGLTPETNRAYQARVYVCDVDLDGRDDLVFWDGDHFRVHRREERGGFRAEPVAHPTEVAFDADGVYAHAFAFAGESELALLTGMRARTEHTVLLHLGDLDGDGLADLVTHSLRGRSLIRLATTVAVHRGRATPDGLRFEREPSSVLRHPGKQPLGYALQVFEDVDGDGAIEAVLVSVDTGLGDGLQAVVANSIDVDLEVYRLAGGAYPDEPAFRHRVRPDHELFGDRGPFFPTILGADLDGDGRRELLTGQNWNELRVYRGVPGPVPFARVPQRLRVPLPANENDARVVDLDGDGRDEVLIHLRNASEKRVVLVRGR